MVHHALTAGLTAIGAVTVLRAAYTLYGFIRLHFTTPKRPLHSYKRAGKQPTYALLTGASAGIGLGIAETLIVHGFGVILLGHLEDELAETAARLRATHPGAAVRTVTVDARDATPEDIQRLVDSLSDLQVSILVNNVGQNPIAGLPFRAFATYSTSDIDKVIDMNARFMARLTTSMLLLLSRRREGAPAGEEKSLIVNTSSAGKAGVPWLVMYGATKGFNWSFSVGLSRELALVEETKHIDCICVVPGDVRSQGNCRGVPPGTITSDVFGRLLVERLDNAVQAGMRELHPYWKHDIENRLLNLIPEKIAFQGLAEAMESKKRTWNEYYEKNM